VGVVSLILPVLITWAVIARVFRLRFWRAVQAWLPTLLSVVVTLPLLLGLVRPFLVEAFTVPTNSMAPTLLGRHCNGTCEVCGSTTYGTPMEEYERSFSHGINTICGKCFHMASDQPVAGPVYGRDRFLVSKFLKPRRWDLVVFRYPEDPSTFYVKRLVGLPGETIFIDQGKVWVNGKALDTPEYLQGLQYVSKFPDMWIRLSGTKDRPAPLGADEYFVLGDFSSQAKDSRLWEHGAEGHPPYAVPESHIVGVVTHIYWPPSRMRILR
jgi:signal peptidase I